jgi:hypothetical protein
LQHGRLFQSKPPNEVEIDPIRWIAASPMLYSVPIEGEPNPVDALRVVVQ